MVDTFRPQVSCDSLEEIIGALQPGKIGNEITYVGKNYSKAALIEDLQRVQRDSSSKLKCLSCKRFKGVGNRCNYTDAGMNMGNEEIGFTDLSGCNYYE